MKNNFTENKTNNSNNAENILESYFKELVKYKNFYVGKNCLISSGKINLEVDSEGNVINQSSQ